MPEYSTYNEYNIVGFSELMQEYIRIVRFVPEDRLVCVENVCWGAVWAHPEDIGDYKKRITLPGWEEGFTDDHHPFEEVPFSRIKAEGWDWYVAKCPLTGMEPGDAFPADYQPLMRPGEIHAFSERFFGLHDGWIADVRMTSPVNADGYFPLEQRPRLKVFFRLPGVPGKPVVELLFTDVRDFRFLPGHYIFGFEIKPQSELSSGGGLTWRDGCYVFSTEPCFRWRRHEIENLGNTHYAVAGKIYWRLVKENM